MELREHAYRDHPGVDALDGVADTVDGEPALLVDAEQFHAGREPHVLRLVVVAPDVSDLLDENRAGQGLDGLGVDDAVDLLARLVRDAQEAPRWEDAVPGVLAVELPAGLLEAHLVWGLPGRRAGA